MKVTEKMIKAFSADENFGGMGNADWEDMHIRAGLEAVFAQLIPDRETVGAVGKATFERYAEQMEGMTHDGHGIPPWDAIGERVREAWVDAAWVAYMLGYWQAETDAADAA